MPVLRGAAVDDPVLGSRRMTTEGSLRIRRLMPKSPRDEVDAGEMWIQERLGERKYRQLRMHLTGARGC
jgi:hypothetical protein